MTSFASILSKAKFREGQRVKLKADFEVELEMADDTILPIIFKAGSSFRVTQGPGLDPYNGVAYWVETKIEIQNAPDPVRIWMSEADIEAATILDLAAFYWRAVSLGIDTDPL